MCAGADGELLDLTAWVQTQFALWMKRIKRVTLLGKMNKIQNFKLALELGQTAIMWMNSLAVDALSCSFSFDTIQNLTKPPFPSLSPVPLPGCMWLRIAVTVAQHKIASLLKILWNLVSFFILWLCINFVDDSVVLQCQKTGHACENSVSLFITSTCSSSFCSYCVGRRKPWEKRPALPHAILLSYLAETSHP